MVYIKLIDDNEMTVSIEALEAPDFVMWQEKNRVPESCSRLMAHGIVSKHGDCIYQLQGRRVMPDRTKKGVTAVIITEAEYDELALRFDETEPEPSDDPQDDQSEPVMTIEQMRIRLAELEALTAERIEFLEDCLLEVSEVIYADD